MPYLGTTGGPGGVGGTVTSRDITTNDGNILAMPLKGNTTDLTGNHTWPAGTFDSTAGYTSESVLDLDTGTSIDVSTGTAHRVAASSAVSFGGFFKLINAPQPSTPYLISSAVSGGLGNHNYSMVFVSGLLNLQSGAGASLRAFDWGPQSHTEVDIPDSEGWVHVIMELEANRTTGRMYVNGKQFGADETSMTAGIAGGSDILIIGGAGGQVAAGELKSFVRNVFITDSLVGASGARSRAENSFGHGLPA